MLILAFIFLACNNHYLDDFEQSSINESGNAREICGEGIHIDTMKDDKIRSTVDIRNDFETLMLLHANCDALLNQSGVFGSSYSMFWTREDDMNWSNTWLKYYIE